MKITILTDNKKSYAVPVAKKLQKFLSARHDVRHIYSQTKLTTGDLAIFLSCERIVPPVILAKNKHNVVVHSSPLPKGKGWSPLTWQILEGKNRIPFTLFEAVEKLDAGDIYRQDFLELSGHELLHEIQKKAGEIIIRMIVWFVANIKKIKGRRQVGRESFYPRRRPADSEVDPHKSLIALFNNFRVANNEQYPVFFRYRGRKYILKIYQDEREADS
ncbi:MAG: arnA [Candidatus Magasanikbacteria bacterium]|nr:arnA [Candidatus Magasanikbacteria bacterium]